MFYKLLWINMSAKGIHVNVSTKLKHHTFKTNTGIVFVKYAGLMTLDDDDYHFSKPVVVVVYYLNGCIYCLNI